MGLHRDGDILGLSNFESEIRRRIWWRIVFLDCIYAQMSGKGQCLLPQNCDVQLPSSANDSDLYPEMTSIKPRQGPSEMIYCLIIYQALKLVIEAPTMVKWIWHGQIVKALEDPGVEEVRRALACLEDLDRSLTETLDKFSSPSFGPIHRFSISLKPSIMASLRAMLVPPQQQPEWGVEIITPLDNLFKVCLIHVENNLELLKQVSKDKHFGWCLTTFFPAEFIVFLSN
ncbi:Pyriculol/pyriculariol biosynthesis cluster transcription factor [Paramyrothecium foliicola]|nr:Pyriculol/pyriculariol biosynthesis cluster transcription factor [Paramyrothecium foliicola]